MEKDHFLLLLALRDLLGVSSISPRSRIKIKSCKVGESATLPKTNITPENRPPQKEISIPTIDFQGIC